MPDVNLSLLVAHTFPHVFSMSAGNRCHEDSQTRCPLSSKGRESGSMALKSAATWS